MVLQTELNSVAPQYTTEPISVNVTLSAGVHVQMFRLRGQSDAKPQCSVLKKYDARAEDQISSIGKKEQAHYSSAGGKSVSCCLRESRSPEKLFVGVAGEEDYTRRPVVFVPLTRQPVLPLQWFREHHTWTEQDLGMRTILR
ncbi:hypothetical protein TNCV_1764761 [Trichonephila clavipes]|nr:hypothetical protein TNCV_1764761 [Trichonephila clavipes]